MPYPHTWLDESALPAPASPMHADALQTYVGETNKTANAWSRIDDDALAWRPHEKSNDLRQIFAHQLLSERRFFAEFLGLDEPPAATLLPEGHDHASATAAAYLARYVDLARPRLPQLAAFNADDWLSETNFFGVPRTRQWVFWRRVLHTAHHRTQVLLYLRLMDNIVPATYGPSGDETWDGADPTQTVAAAG